MPTTSPLPLTSGPPLFPGEEGAEYWTTSVLYSLDSLTALTMPSVIVPSRPRGLPMATTDSPKATADESASGRGGTSVIFSTCRTAKSIPASAAITEDTGYIIFSAVFTYADTPPAITW